MAYIAVEEGVPGIRSLFNFRPETGKPLCELAETLLRGVSSLSSAERELIAAYVSQKNDCLFCMNSHAAAARCWYGDQQEVVDELLEYRNAGSLSPKIKALLVIAGKVQNNGKSVTSGDIELARKAGAADSEIHDTVLIAASFSMFNRYVDGLGTWAPQDRSFYINRAPQRAEEGYIGSILK